MAAHEFEDIPRLFRRPQLRLQLRKVLVRRRLDIAAIAPRSAGAHIAGVEGDHAQRHLGALVLAYFQHRLGRCQAGETGADDDVVGNIRQRTLVQVDLGKRRVVHPVGGCRVGDREGSGKDGVLEHGVVARAELRGNLSMRC